MLFESSISSLVLYLFPLHRYFTDFRVSKGKQTKEIRFVSKSKILNMYVINYHLDKPTVFLGSQRMAEIKFSSRIISNNDNK